MKLEKIIQGRFRDFGSYCKHNITTRDLSNTNFALGEKLSGDFLNLTYYQLGIEEAYAISRTTGDAAKFGSYHGPLDYIASGFIFNAIDSLTERWSDDLEFQAYLRISVDNDTALRVEVEDNGTGIKRGEELFIDRYGSKKDSSAMHGHEGVHLYNSRVLIEALDGRIGFVNKGMNKGATFWYEVPLSSLTI